MSTGRRIASATLWQLASQVVMALLSIITVKLVSQGLSVELAGYYNTSYGFLQIFAILADFGLYAVAIREVSRLSEADQPRMLGTVLVLRCAITALSFGCALLFAWVLPSWRHTPLPLSVTLAAFVPVLTLITGVLRVVFQVRYRMKWVFVAEVTQRVVAVTLILSSVGFGFAWFAGPPLGIGVRSSSDPFTLYWFIIAGGIGAAALLSLSIIGAIALRAFRFTFDPSLFLLLLRRAAPYGVAFLCTALYRQTDITLMSVLRSDFAWQNAVYGFTQRALEMGYLIPTFLLNSVLPTLGQRRLRGLDVRSILQRTLTILLLLSILMSVTAFVFARPIMVLLTRPLYLSVLHVHGADTALRILSGSLLVNGLVLYAFYALLDTHRWRPLVRTLLLGALLSLLCNTLLIPHFGFIGAAATSVFVHCTLAMLLLWQLSRDAPVTPSARLSSRLLILFVLYGLATAVLRPFAQTNLWTILLLPILAVIYLLLTWALGILRELKVW